MTPLNLFKFFCLAIAVYGSHPLEKVYDHHEFLDGKSKYQLLWSVDRAAEEIELACIVNTTGWIGFGIAKGMAGKMEGSDIVIGFVSADGKGYLQDSHGVGNTVPVKDEKNDYILKGSEEKDGQTIIRFSRKFKTCDQEDNMLKDGTVKVIYAYSDSDPESNFKNGLKYHSLNNRGSISMNLFNYLPLTKLDDTKEHIDFLQDKFNIPAQATTYWCTLHTITRKQLGGKRHVTAFAPVRNPPNNPYAHHLTILKCVGLPEDRKNRTGECFTPYMSHFQTNCMIHTFGWAPGTREEKFPDHVGFPIGEDEVEYYMVQMHYDNPMKSTDLIDSSGIRFYLSDKLRQHDMGILMYGIQIKNDILIPPQQKEWYISGYCPSKCFQNETLQQSKDNSFRIFAANVHEHLTGTGAWVTQIRGDTEIIQIVGDDNYDFDFQGTQRLEKELEYRMTDDLRITCRYNTMKRREITQGGLGTYQEMCTGRFYYYPRTNVTSCISTNLESGIFSDKYAPKPKNVPRNRTPRNWTDVQVTDGMIQTLKVLEKKRERSAECTVRGVGKLDKIYYDIKTPLINNPLLTSNDQCQEELHSSSASKSNLAIQLLCVAVLLNMIYYM